MTDDEAWRPGAPVTGGDWDRLAATAYTGVRDGTLTPEAAFDLATFLMDWALPRPVFAELAQACVASDQAGLAPLTSRALEAVGYVPGFTTEPRLLAALQQALDVVTLDLRATDLTGTARLAAPEDRDLGNVWITYDNQYGSTSGLSPADAACPDASAVLVRVADELQDAVMEALFSAWPGCPHHLRGGHPEARDGKAVWWCNGGGGHVICAIGHWT